MKLFTCCLPVCCLLALAIIVPSARAGEYNEVLSIGDAAPAWNDLPGTDGKLHRLADLESSPVVVVVFTCASCPTAVDYESRINALATRQPEQVAVMAICVNQVPADSLSALTARVKEKELHFTYLVDESQQIARQYGAVFTPEFYVLNRERKIVYMGAMDDQTDPAKVTQSFVDEAVAAALAGKLPETREVIARGCRVRYARERRTRP